MQKLGPGRLSKPIILCATVPGFAPLWYVALNAARVAFSNASAGIKLNSPFRIILLRLTAPPTSSASCVAKTARLIELSTRVLAAFAYLAMLSAALPNLPLKTSFKIGVPALAASSYVYCKVSVRLLQLLDLLINNQVELQDFLHQPALI